MSANNWTVCPKCKLESQQAAKTLYGSVPEDEYIKQLEAFKQAASETNMREDYELGTDGDGWFSISYSCYCTKCHFRFDCSHSEQLDLKKVE